MKCPVCDNENRSALCPRCGFDSSRDYGRYPTFGSVGMTTSVSALRVKWHALQRELQNEWQKTVESTPAESEQQPVVVPEKPVLPEEPKKPVPPPTEPAKPARRFLIWPVAAVCTVVVALGSVIGIGGGKSDPAEPGESVEIQAPSEMNANPELWRNNILCSDEVSDINGDGYIDFEDSKQIPVFGSNYHRDQIRSVTFLDTLANITGDSWDVSEAGNGTVMAWVKPNGELYDLYIGAEGGVSAGKSCVGLFMGYENAIRIDFHDSFHTDGAENMSWMFCHCTGLEFLDLSGFDTSNVQNMYSMFSECWMIENLDLSGFYTSNVKDMRGMFCYCVALRTLDLHSFDTTNVQNMRWMFANCENLECLDLSIFDTSNVQNMSGMFRYCKTLNYLNLSSFDTSNVQDMSDMFHNCESLTSLDLSSFATSNANTGWMFIACPAGDEWGHLLN